jgi:hypothetical protein
MRRTISLILALAIIAPIAMKNVVLVQFYMNRDRIAKELCEERNNEKSCCKGSCVLEKELNKVEDHNTDLPAPFKDKTEVVYCFEPIEELIWTNSTSIEHFTHYSFHISNKSTQVLLQPPRA